MDSAIMENEKMDDYISRQAAVSICDNAIDLWNGQLGVGALVAVRDAIKALPAARAQWECVDYGVVGNWHCSKCRAIGSKFYKYCPNCGAIMDKPTE